LSSRTGGAAAAPQRWSEGGAPALRVLADDLTGALDTAAQFTGALGPLPVLLEPGRWPRSAAFDSGLRDASPELVRAKRAGLVDFLASAELAYLKIDSLLRGHTFSDIAEIFRRGGYRSCILAPAFPAQGRSTRQGVQHELDHDGVWRPVGPPLVEGLRALGIDARLVPPGAMLGGEGVMVCDADSEADLDAIADAGIRLGEGAPGRLLWCGTAGLARAIAGRAPAGFEGPLHPLLIVVGSRHPRSRAQLNALTDINKELLIEIAEGAGADAAPLSALLNGRGTAVLGFRFGDSVDLAAAMQGIRGTLNDMLKSVSRPAALLVTGGETLRATCEALGTRKVVVWGELRAGFPAARLIGGLWDGTTVISKSGAFGDADALVNLAFARERDRPLLGESA
jgi:uncharacterized protein YgbK (DUF1537 family)